MTKGLYPLSTQDGKAIPLDVVKPASMVSYNFAANTAGAIVIPASYGLCYVFATQNCILRLSATALPAGLVSGTEYQDTFFIPANTLMTIFLTGGAAQLLGGAYAGSLNICSVEQWGAFLQSRQVQYG
jgi:hypothetical protein